MTRRLRVAVAVLSALALALALWGLGAGGRGLVVTQARVGGTPVSVYSRPGALPAPAVVIAHGFAGSGRLMGAFATTLAQAGYVAVIYDALGHGRNPRPLAGDVTSETGATAALLAELGRVAAFARALPEANGRLALVGHSMASDIVVRQAIADPGVRATVAVSLFSPAVTAQAPANLLVVTGAWEAGLADEALRVAGLGTGAPAAPFATIGDPSTGPARRAVLAPGVEHVGVLFSRTALAETRAWLDASFGRRPASGRIDVRGPWVALWLVCALGLGWALAPLLPRLAPEAPPARRRWRETAPLALLPAVATPPLAWMLPAGLIPVAAPVADYLALHFLIYGLLTAGLLGLAGGWRGWRAPPLSRLAAASAAYLGFALVVVFLPADRYLTSFLPPVHRLPLLAVLALCLAPYALADEALARRVLPRGGYFVTKVCFLGSLALAIGLDPPRLFFLAILLPVMLAVFTIFGLFSRWSFGATGIVLPAALGNAVLFAWALGVTFPLLGG